MSFMDLMVLNESLKVKVKPTELLVRSQGTATRRERSGESCLRRTAVNCDDTCVEMP